jgi:hypothetical protein
MCDDGLVAQHDSLEPRIGSMVMSRNSEQARWAVTIAWALAAALCGCVSTTTVYKDTAGDFVAAAKGIAPALSSAEGEAARLVSGQQIRHAASDASCPMVPVHIYLSTTITGKPTVPDRYFTGLAAQANVTAQCQAMVDCEASHTCGSACYGEAQARCIDVIRHVYSAKAAAPDASSEARSDWQAIDRRITAISLDTDLGARYLASASVSVFANYLDVLSQAADGKAPDLEKKLQDLANRVDSVNGTFKSLTNSDLLDPTSLANVDSQLGALGKFFQDIKTMQRNAHDTATIRKAVAEMKEPAMAAMKDMQTRIKGDLNLVAAHDEADALKARNAINVDYRNASSNNEREALLVKRLAMPIGQTNVDVKVDAVFSAAKAAHDTLVQLIEDPSQAQQRQLREAQYKVFLSAAEDLVSLINVLS